MLRLAMHEEAAGSHALATLLAVALFSLVWLGLGSNIRKIAGRTANPPSFNPLLNAAHLGRFAGWALLGAATFGADAWTGGMLIATRTPAVGLVVVTFLQRRVLRPSPRLLAGWLLPTLGGLVLVCAGLIRYPPSDWAVRALEWLVAGCFAAQVLYALPLQIWEARRKPLGNLRWFQLALLANYACMLLYTLWVREERVQLLMRVAYGAVFIEQLVFVLQIEHAMGRRRASLREP